MDWIRKHSPLKSRNKPLPYAPYNQSPTRSPIKPISANVSPSKFREHVDDRVSEKKHSKRQHKQDYTENDELEPVSETLQPRRVIKFRKQSREKPSTEVHNLSERVTSLEAQLEEARRELKSVIKSKSSETSDDTADVLRQRQARPSLDKRRIVSDGSMSRRQSHPSSSVLDKEANRRSLGIVHEEKQKDRNGESAAPQRSRELGGEQYLLDPHHKRKRSELRQASWDQIQNHLAQQQQHQEPTSKRAKHVSSRPIQPQYNKQLPPSPQQKTPVKPKSGSGSRSREKDVTNSSAVRLVNPEAEAVRDAKDARDPITGSDEVGTDASTDARPSKSRPTERTRPTTAAGVKSESESGSVKEARAPDADDVFSPAERLEPDREPDEETLQQYAFSISRPPSPSRRHVPAPTRLDPVDEEYEWDDDVF